MSSNEAPTGKWREPLFQQDGFGPGLGHLLAWGVHAVREVRSRPSVEVVVVFVVIRFALL